MDKEFYRDLLDQISDGVYFVTRDRHITYWNRGAESITGFGAEEVLGRSCSEGILRHITDSGCQLCLHGCPLAGVMTDGRPREAHVYLHHKDGQRVPVTVRGHALLNPQGAIVGSAEVFSPRMSNAYAGQRQVGKNELLDPVTGLPPRRLGELNLQTLMRAVADRVTTLGVLFIDADHFKNINDTLGHKTGDHVLRMVAQSTANGLRRDDIPIRWGGDEFLVLLPGIDRVGLQATAERVRVLVENSWIQDGQSQARVSVSIGATMALPTESVDDLVDRSDRLMYASKHAGRNRGTSDGGELTSTAEDPIIGTGVPWQMPGQRDLDGLGSGEPNKRNAEINVSQ
jgi:diguanylate cyclase (GGDEF)-like protein/PAS domain S-box-containing protein